MINDIQLKNFRRFQNLPTMEFNGINLLVGSNNAGKSSLVKAMILMLDNMKNMKATEERNIFAALKPVFDFDPDNYHLHVGDFETAYSFNAPSEEKEMSVGLTLDGIKVEYHLYDVNTKYLSTAPVSMIKISIASPEEIVFTFDFMKGVTTVEFSPSSTVSFEQSNDNEHIAAKLAELKALQDKETDIEVAAKRNLEILRISELLENANSQVNNRSYRKIELTLVSFSDVVNENLLHNLLYSLIKFSEMPMEATNKRSKEYKEEKEIKDTIQENKISILEVIERLMRAINSTQIYYIPAHAATQNTVFLTNNDSDYLAKTIREFQKSRIVSGEDEYQFILDWLGSEEGRFNIADGFKIDPIDSEAYKFMALANGKEVRLASLGMGSIQIITLLLRLSIIMRKTKGRRVNTLIFMEEPEQNLHPNWQSMLMDLFDDFKNKSLNIENKPVQIFAETHSEYLIRRAQVLHAKAVKNEKDEPCSVFYFPENGVPYDMGFQDDGKFIQDFGPGFFNVADDASMELFNLQYE